MSSNPFRNIPHSPVGRHRRSSGGGTSSSIASSGSGGSDGSRKFRRRSRVATPPAASGDQTGGTSTTTVNDSLPPPLLVYHESAHSIVFRDHLRRAADAAESKQKQEQQSSGDVLQRVQVDDHSQAPLEISRMPSTELEEMANVFNGSMLMGNNHTNADTNPPVIHASSSSSSSTPSTQHHNAVEIHGFQPTIVPLPHLELGPNDEFQPLLLESNPSSDWTPAEQEVFQLLQTQQAVIKTVKNCDWTAFLYRFKAGPQPDDDGHHHHAPDNHRDIPSSSAAFPFNSFVTSTSLLPAGGKKMRCFGSPTVYTTGVVFALPSYATPNLEDQAAITTRTWMWPSGYAAKTEFNVDGGGRLINGREEALVSFSALRQYNHDYQTKEDYIIAGRLLKGGLKTVPYNEVFIRVGGPGRIVQGRDAASEHSSTPAHTQEASSSRSLETGVGLPVALFVRTATFGHLISLLRTRARLMHVWGEKHVQGIPLLLICPDKGVRTLTEHLQTSLLQIASKNLNPFQNPSIAHKTTLHVTDEKMLETKLEELIDLDENIRKTLTPEECVRLAGGFGATDDSIAQILKDALIQDKESLLRGDTPKEAHKLQDIVNEGLASSVRSGDYYTSRQLLILYSLIASDQPTIDHETNEEKKESTSQKSEKPPQSEAMLIHSESAISSARLSGVPARPPPPPLDTDRLRSATNSDGLLAVLGAAQILKAMRDGSAKVRTEESFLSVEEWCEHGEQSMVFRLASWRDQRAAQDDLKIAFDKDSSFMAFVSNKAISNRKLFAQKLRDATTQTDFTDVRFLNTIYEMVCRMHSPCLRLELLQYVLGLDNRYSIAHVKRSVELAATCLSITTSHSDSS